MVCLSFPYDLHALIPHAATDDIVRARLRTIGVEEYKFTMETASQSYQPLFVCRAD